MKHTIYFTAIIALFIACKQHVTNETATEVTTETNRVVEDTNSVTLNEPSATETSTLELTPLGNSGEFDFPSELAETYVFSQNGKSIIEFNEIVPADTKTSGKVSGKIIINGKIYKLNKSVRVGDSGYTVSGEGIIINIPKTTWIGDGSEGDCQEGKAPIIKISLGNQELELKNIKVDYCVTG